MYNITLLLRISTNLTYKIMDKLTHYSDVSKSSIQSAVSKKYLIVNNVYNKHLH